MSYYNAETGLYACGVDDMPYVAFWTIVFTGMRVLVMEYVLDPLAKAGGMRTKKGLDRFKEQAWLIVYYTASWSLGMVCSELLRGGALQKLTAHSTSCTTLISGSISTASGRAGLSEKLKECSNSTTSFSGLSGSNKCSLLISKRSAKTTRRCSCITSSQRYCCSCRMDTTTRASVSSFCASWTLWTSSYL
jgi:hypothetical protein